MLTDRKLQASQVPPPWHSGYGVRTTVLTESRIRGSNPVRAVIFSLF